MQLPQVLFATIAPQDPHSLLSTLHPFRVSVLLFLVSQVVASHGHPDVTHRARAVDSQPGGLDNRPSHIAH